MSDGRNRLRKHIRAAKEWLGRAENSLEKENDVRGDLNLMLAQAELQRAEETKRLNRRQRYLQRLMPVAAAVAMVGGCFLFFRGMQPEQVVLPAVTMQKQEVGESKVSPVEPEQPQKMVQTASAAKHELPSVEKAETKAKVSLPQIETEREESRKDQEGQAVSRNSIPQQTKMPSQDMQKLMQSAGKTLRAQ